MSANYLRVVMADIAATFSTAGRKEQADQHVGGRESYLEGTKDFGPLKVLMNLTKFIHARRISPCPLRGRLWVSGRGHDPILVFTSSNHVKK